MVDTPNHSQRDLVQISGHPAPTTSLRKGREGAAKRRGCCNGTPAVISWLLHQDRLIFVR